MKNKKLYYVLNLTWGLPMTLLGAIVAIVLLIIGKKPKRHGGCWYFNVGKSWGGCELGLFFLTDSQDNDSVKTHEFGHSIQNARFGLLMPFIVCIPSAVRYWYRELWFYRRGRRPKTAYDDIWFEGQATRLGKENLRYWEKEKGGAG